MVRAVFAVLLSSAAIAFGQAPPAVAPPITPLTPPGNGGTFGPPPNQLFTPNTMFPPKPAVVQQPVGSPNCAPDGGLFPCEPPPPKLWKGSFDFGLTGATGNSENLNIRTFWTADRKTDVNLFHSDLTYQLGKNNGITNQNTMILNARDEILTAGSPWSYFTSTNIEYDEQKDYKFLVGVYAGVAYKVIDCDGQTLKLRAAAGAVKRVGTPEQDWQAELDLGYDYKIKLTDRSCLISVLDYYPRIDDFSMYRVRFRVAYENIVDPAMGAFFRIGCQERYDSNPGAGKNTSDLSYFMAFGFTF